MTNDLQTRVAASLHREGDRFDVPASNLDDVVHRARRRSTTRRVTVGTLAVLLLAAGGLVVVGRDHTSTGRINTGGTPSTVTPEVSLSRPVLDSCTPTFATQTTSEGAFALPPAPTEMFADPARGLNGPLAAVLRFPGTGRAPVNDGTVGAKIANGDVNGREASYAFSPNTHGGLSNGGVNWDLADGGTAMIYARGLNVDELHAFADAVDAETPTFPQGLQSIGMVTATQNASSQCQTADGGQTGVITEVRGSLASRYAQMLSLTGDISLRLIDTTDSSIVIWSATGEFDPNGWNYHQATPDEWSRLLKAAPNAAGPSTAPSAPTARLSRHVTVHAGPGLTWDHTEYVARAGKITITFKGPSGLVFAFADGAHPQCALGTDPGARHTCHVTLSPGRYTIEDPVHADSSPALRATLTVRTASNAPS